MIYIKYLVISIWVGFGLPIWKRVQVRGLEESLLTIRGDKDQDLVAFEEDLKKTRHIVSSTVSVSAKIECFLTSLS